MRPAKQEVGILKITSFTSCLYQNRMRSTAAINLSQVQLCYAQNDDVFLPTPKVKTLEPSVATPTPLPVTERNLWGIRLWQVVGLAFVATVILSK